MTYCVGMKLDAGLVFASDSRTNAGVDNISRFEKMRVFAQPGNRVIVTLSAGNLSVTQNTLNLLDRRIAENAGANLMSVASLVDVAELLGSTMREVRNRDDYLRANNIDASASFIVGGQIAGETPRLFLIYSEGNFIESSTNAPYFQIGELKYGKPMIDRVLRSDLPLTDAVKLTLVSFDSTMRSNVSVGLPIDLLVYDTDSIAVTRQQRIEEGDAYWRELGNHWNEGLRQAFAAVPLPEWLSAGAAPGSGPANPPG
jgi:putative proteasome-type protease